MIEERRVTSAVVGRIVERARLAAERPGGRPLDEVVNETLYLERERLKRARGEAADADRAFYARLQRELPRASKAEQLALLDAVVRRYAGEIAGRFDERVYRLATSALPTTLGLLLTSLSPRRMARELRLLHDLDEHIVLEGELDALRRLQRLGTVVLVPTHSSNLDSVLMGYAVYRMGLPPVTYGAGLNLFSNPIIGFFMRNLGAYTVDRLKTDPLYRDTLKEYTTVALELGQSVLFFPGGTRSRSGALETHLKKGLLGCGVQALRNNLRHGRPKPRVFYVPVTLAYPLVLEASTLIEDYLAETGKARYIIVDDEFSRLQRWLAFFRGLLQIDLRIHVRVGRALDPLGNDVDADGRSLDPRGRVVDPARYLMDGGELVEDAVRDAEYTKALAGRIVEAFRAENVVQPTHVLAFAAFEALRRERPGQDVYRLLRGVDDDTTLRSSTVEALVGDLLVELRALAQQGRLRLVPAVETGDVAEVLRRALRSFRTYHTTPVLEARGAALYPRDAKLVFYYRNRLEGYGLLGAPDLLPKRREA